MFFFNFKQDELQDYYLAYFDILGYKSYFEKCLESFLNISNIKSKINKNLLDCSEYNKENSLFDSQDVLSMDTIKNISKSNEEKGLGE